MASTTSLRSIRSCSANRPIAQEENFTSAQALDGYLSDPLTPGGAVRRSRAGIPADVVLLHDPRHEVLLAPHADLVRETWIAGQRIDPDRRAPRSRADGFHSPKRSRTRERTVTYGSAQGCSPTRSPEETCP